MITHQQYLRIAKVIAESSYCKRNQVGAILVKRGNIISFGYNGTIAGAKNECEDEEGQTLKSVLHAESNLIAKMAAGKESTEGSILYTTLSPCFDCCKLIVQCHIYEVHYLDEYRDTSGLDLLGAANITVRQHSL